MRLIAVMLLSAGLVACRGENPPRDYQNSPPAVTTPVTTSSGTPTAHGMPNAKPEPSKGAEGQNLTGQPVDATAPSTTLKDTAPAQTATATTGT